MSEEENGEDAITKALTTKVLEIRHKIESGESLSSDEKEELESLRAKMSALANAEYEKQKNATVEKFRNLLGDEKAEEMEDKITGVVALENAKDLISVLEKRETGESSSTKSYAGIATREIPTAKGEYRDYKDLIDSVIEKIGQHNRPSSERSEPERKQALGMLDKLLHSLFIEGKEGRYSTEDRMKRLSQWGNSQLCGNCSSVEPSKNKKCSKCGFVFELGDQQDTRSGVHRSEEKRTGKGIL